MSTLCITSAPYKTFDSSSDLLIVFKDLGLLAKPLRPLHFFKRFSILYPDLRRLSKCCLNESFLSKIMPKYFADGPVTTCSPLIVRVYSGRFFLVNRTACVF